MIVNNHRNYNFKRIIDNYDFCHNRAALLQTQCYMQFFLTIPECSLRKKKHKNILDPVCTCPFLILITWDLQNRCVIVQSYKKATERALKKIIPNSIGTSKSAFSSTCVDDTSDSTGTSSGISLQSTQMHFSSGGPDREAQSLCTHLQRTSNTSYIYAKRQMKVSLFVTSWQVLLHIGESLKVTSILVTRFCVQH